MKNLFQRGEHSSRLISNNAILKRTKRQDFKNSKSIKAAAHLLVKIFITLLNNINLKELGKQESKNFQVLK